MHWVRPPVHQAAGQDAYLPWDRLNNQIFVYTFTPAHAHAPEVRDQTSLTRDANQQSAQDRQFQRDHSFYLDCSVPSDRPFRADRLFWDSGQQLAGDRPPHAFRLGPFPRQTTPNNVTHNVSGTEICKRYNVGKCTLIWLPVHPFVLDTWLPWVTPGQRVSKTPQMSSAELKHPYDTLSLSAS